MPDDKPFQASIVTSSMMSDFDLLADAMPQLVWIAEPDGVVIYYNNRIKEFAGAQRLPSGRWEWQGMVHEDDARETEERWGNAIATGTMYEIEHRIKMLDGSFKWHLSRSLPQKDKAGNVVKWYGTATDIHQQKVLEEQIKWSEERYATTVEASDIGLWDYNVATNKFSIAGKMAAIYGIPANKEVTQHTSLEAIYPEDKEYVLNIYHAVMNRALGPTFQFEHRILHGITHELKWVRAKGKAFYDAEGKLTRTVGTITDITLRKHNEQALKNSEERFRLLTNAIPQIVFFTGADGNIQYISDQWFHLTGQDAQKGLQNWAEMLHPDDVSLVNEKWQLSVRDKKALEIEYRIKTKTGEYRWYFLKSQPHFDKHGNVKQWIGAATDIQYFKDVSSILEQEVQTRTVELEGLNYELKKQAEELKRSNEDLQQFAYVTSHDLQEPLRKIKTFTSLINKESKEELSDKSKVYFSRIEKASERMFSMIQSILTYSKVKSREEVFSIVDVNEIIKGIETDLELIIQQKKASILFQDLPTIEGSAVLINQLFFNLINNSLKFSRTDVAPLVHITSCIVSGALLKNQVDLALDKPYIEFRIQDNGIGFAKEHADSIFKSFTRLNPKDRFEGTGLGLSICKKIVERHSGFIFADAEEDHGAIFKVLLPYRTT